MSFPSCQVSQTRSRRQPWSSEHSSIAGSGRRTARGRASSSSGEAGIGKSRLVYQLHEHLTAVPHTWLECGATPYTVGTPFHPIIALAAQGLAFAPEDTAAQ